MSYLINIGQPLHLFAFSYCSWGSHSKNTGIISNSLLQTTLSVFWEICLQVKDQQLELDMEKQAGLKLAKEHVKSVYYHPAGTTYTQVHCEKSGLDKSQTGIKIARRKKKINKLRYADDTTLMAESEEELQRLLKVKEESEKPGLKLTIQKTMIMSSDPTISWQIDG